MITLIKGDTRTGGGNSAAGLAIFYLFVKNREIEQNEGEKMVRCDVGWL